MTPQDLKAGSTIFALRLHIAKYMYKCVLALPSLSKPCIYDILYNVIYFLIPSLLYFVEDRSCPHVI